MQTETHQVSSSSTRQASTGSLSHSGQRLLDSVTSRAAQEVTAANSSSPREWLVLLAFCLNTALNAFLSVNFSVIEKISRDTLHVDKDSIAWLYTGFLLTVAVGMFPTLPLVTKCEGLALGLSVAMNVGSAWVRWIGLRSADYSLCFVSAVLNAAGAWALLPLPAQLSRLRFPARLRTLTTSLAIQANYSGWLLGSMLPPNLIQRSPPPTHKPSQWNKPSQFSRFAFTQALVSMVVVLIFGLFYRPARPLPDGSSDHNHGTGHGHGGFAGGGLRSFLSTLRKYPSFSIQMLSCGILGGISFSITGISDFILGPHKFDPSTVASVNSAFLASGIVAGILLGARVSRRNYGCVLRVLFITCALALAALAVLISLNIINDSRPRNLAIVIVLFALVGISSLGFIGIGIEAAACYPADGAYVCFTIEAMVQVFGAVFNQVANGNDGFTILAACAWFAAVAMVCGYRDFNAGLFQTTEDSAVPGDVVTVNLSGHSSMTSDTDGNKSQLPSEKV